MTFVCLLPNRPDGRWALDETVPLILGFIMLTCLNLAAFVFR